MKAISGNIPDPVHGAEPAAVRGGGGELGHGLHLLGDQRRDHLRQAERQEQEVSPRRHQELGVVKYIHKRSDISICIYKPCFSFKATQMS